jgi:hypothetical protein
MNPFREGYGEKPTEVRTRTIANRMRVVAHAIADRCARWRAARSAPVRCPLGVKDVLRIAVAAFVAAVIIAIASAEPMECMHRHEEQRCTTQTNERGETTSSECHDEMVCDLWSSPVKKTREVPK